MTADPTEHQSSDEQQRSREMSQDRRSPPLAIPGYECRKFLGSGAYGEVWVALDQNTGRRVAIKFYSHQSGLDWSLLSREVEKLVFLAADRYVVQLLDVGWTAEPPYYVMEYIENGSLEDHLRDHGSMPVGQAVEVFRDVAKGLLHTHGKGVLHCDLKPANILLDQDFQPRLADFGQSRLSHEQTPALGTLFYMAPEQADLEAVPDARWDVYALGALLYCMLTGEAPHRNEKAVSEIDSVDNLSERLVRYRDYLRTHSLPDGHRSIEGIDRSLIEIVDRCLAVDPNERYPNVQSVLDALDARDALHERRPLLILGLIGPLLFLMITVLFAWWGYLQAVGDSERLLLVRGQMSNSFAADFVSEAVARRIEGYFRAVDEVAGNPEFQNLLKDFKDLEADLLDQMRAAEPGSIRQQQLRTQLRNLDTRELLQERIELLLDAPHLPEIASWFVTDEHGFHLAAAFDTSEEVESSVGHDYSHRTYFHGGPTDERPPDGKNLNRTHLSAVFQSGVTGTWKVAVSTPVTQDNEFHGVVALTVELGGLGKPLGEEGDDRQFNVLVDGRQGDSKGVILQHPLFTSIRASGDRLDTDFSTSPEYRVPLDNWNEQRLYQDPLGRHPKGAAFKRKWIAAKREVRLDPMEQGLLSKRPIDTETGLIVIVQENYDVAATPVHQLGSALVFRGVLALAVVFLVVIVLWYFVARALNGRAAVVRRKGRYHPSHSTIHSMDTLEQPTRLMRSSD